MATIIKQPTSLSFSKNLKKFEISASSEIRFKLSQGGSLIVDESYLPNSQGRVIIDVENVISNYLVTAIPVGNIYVQTEVVKTFSAQVDSLPEINFTVVRGGVENLADTATNFLISNWLTWQPQVKKVTYSQPEWLTYYATEAAVIKVRFYLKDGSSTVVVVNNQTPGTCVSYNMQFAYIMTLAEGEKFGYYDVWVENSTGTRLTYIQRYVYRDAEDQDEMFVFENSLGGVDTSCMTGESNFTPEVVYQQGTYDDVAVQVDNYFTRLYDKSTGWISKQEGNWLFDFFNSYGRYKLVDGVLRKITLQDSSISDSSQEDLKSYSFVYRFSEDRGLLNIPRSMDVPPANLEISTPESLFFLAPRLVDFQSAELEDELLFPVQSPFTEFWQKLSWGAIWQFLYDKILASAIGLMAHVHDNLAVLGKLSEDGGNLLYGGAPVSGGGSDSGLQLGESSLTAYRGDRGKIAYDHSQSSDVHFADVPNDDTTYARNNKQWVPLPTPGGAAVRLSTNKQVFEYDKDGNLVTPGDYSWIYTTLFNISADTIYYQFSKNGTTLQNTTASVLSYVPPATYSSPDVITVVVRKGYANGTVIATDTISMYGIKPGADGQDAYTVVLSNPAHAFSADANGNVTDYSGSGTDIRVRKGIVALDYGAGPLTFSVSAAGTNINPGTASTVNANIRRYGNANNMISASAAINFTITVRDENSVETVFTQVMTFAISKAGQDGTDGDDGAPGADGQDAYTVVLSNPAHAFPADANGNVTDYSGSGTDIRVWKGIVALDYGAGPLTFSVSAAGTNVNPGTASTVNANIRRYGNANNMISASAAINFTITVRDKNSVETVFTQVMTFAISKAGQDGTDGEDGAPGPVGPSLVFRGEYNAAATYVGNSKRIDMVKYTANGKYYAALADAGSFSGKAPIDAQYWEIADGQFEFVATKLLFAESTYVRNLIAEQLKTAESGRRVEINAGDKQQVAIYDAFESLKVLVKPEPISTLSVIQSGSATAYQSPTADVATKTTAWSTPNFGTVTYRQESASFAVTLDGTLEIEIGNISLTAGKSDGTYCAALSTVSVILEKYTYGTWNYVALIGSCSEYESSKSVSETIKGLTAGTYRLVAVHEHFSWTDWIEGMPVIQDSCSAFSRWNYYSGSAFSITIRRVIAQTEIGTDGIASIWATNKYFHFSQNGLFVKMGTKTFEVSESGVKINGIIHS